MLKPLYNWTAALADKKHATWALAAVAFAESSVFPLPPDLMLAPMSLAKPEKSWHYAAVCTIASVLGGIVGYGIGHLLFESAGMWILNLYGYADKIDGIKAAYAHWGALLILLKGVTPIPFKLVTIVSGALDYNFPMFVILSLITRGARFYILAGLFHKFGDPIRNVMEKNLGLFVGGLMAIIVLGFVLAAKLA